MGKEMSRTSGPLTDMLEWFDLGMPRGRRGIGLDGYVRVEDYLEDGAYVLRAELPGLDPDNDVTVAVQGDVLTISGERHEEKKERHYQEFLYGSFRRSVALPKGANADEVRASYTDGVLEVRVPVGDAPQAPKTIPVERS